MFFKCQNWYLVWGIFVVPFRQGERIGFSYLVSQKYTGDTATVKILRDSKILEFDINLAIPTHLIPTHINGKLPSYYIVAGFVFAAVSVPYLRSEVNFIFQISWLFLFRRYSYTLFLYTPPAFVKLSTFQLPSILQVCLVTMQTQRYYVSCCMLRIHIRLEMDHLFFFVTYTGFSM